VSGQGGAFNEPQAGDRQAAERHPGLGRHAWTCSARTRPAPSPATA
jgi:hypothetical protein